MKGRNILCVAQAVLFPVHFLLFLLPCVKTSVFSSHFYNGYKAWLGARGADASFGGVITVIFVIIGALAALLKLLSDADLIKKWGTYSVLGASALVSLLAFCGSSAIMVTGTSSQYFTLAAGAVIIGILDLLSAAGSALELFKPEILEIPFSK